MKITLLNVKNLAGEIRKISNEPLKMKVSVAISKIFLAIEEYEELYNHKYKQLFESYGTRGSNGDLTISPENKEVFLKEMDDLNKSPIELPDNLTIPCDWFEEEMRFPINDIVELARFIQ